LKNGEFCQVFVQTSPLKDNWGNVVAVIELLTNITEIKKTQKELSILGHSIALLSHGIKNILEGLQGGTYVVEEGIKDGDMKLARKGWDIVKKNIFDITDVAQNILYSSKDRPLNYQEVDPNRLAEETVSLFKDRSSSLGVSLTCIPDISLPLVSVGAASIRRMLQNLVWNAIESCLNDPGCKSSYMIYLQTGFHGEGCFKFEVTDNGMGMDENTEKNIFDDFFSTKGGKGTGLGLSVVKKIVNRHGGTIEVESSLGEGSLFRIILPIGIK
jgi:signal transduction histidine kinase